MPWIWIAGVQLKDKKRDEYTRNIEMGMPL